MGTGRPVVRWANGPVACGRTGQWAHGERTDQWGHGRLDALPRGARAGGPMGERATAFLVTPPHIPTSLRPLGPVVSWPGSMSASPRPDYLGLRNLEMPEPRTVFAYRRISPPRHPRLGEREFPRANRPVGPLANTRTGPLAHCQWANGPVGWWRRADHGAVGERTTNQWRGGRTDHLPVGERASGSVANGLTSGATDVAAEIQQSGRRSTENSIQLCPGLC